jgi:hypothetical protein
VSRQLLNRNGPQRAAWHVTSREWKRDIMCCCQVLLPLAPRPVVIGLSGPIRESIDPCAVTCHVPCAIIEFGLLYRSIKDDCYKTSSRYNDARRFLNVAQRDGMRGASNNAVMYEMSGGIHIHNKSTTGRRCHQQRTYMYLYSTSL